MDSNRGGVFWTLVGVGILALLLAAGWRVATGAALEATGREWSLKVTEAADKVDAARAELEEQLKRVQDELTKRDAFWQAQLAAARKACPNIGGSKPVVPPVAESVKELAKAREALTEVEKATSGAREAARDIPRIRLQPFRF